MDGDQALGRTALNHGWAHANQNNRSFLKKRRALLVRKVGADGLILDAFGRENYFSQGSLRQCRQRFAIRKNKVRAVEMNAYP